MKLRQLEYFVATAETLHFRRAAARLRIAQPSLTQQIQRLERELDVALFTRNSHQVELTPAGTAFLGRARAAVELSRLAASAARAGAAGRPGTARVGFVRPAGDLFADALDLLSVRAPGTSVDLREMSTMRQLEALGRHELDAGIVLGGAGGPGLRCTPLDRWERFTAVVAPDHPLAGTEPLPVSALVGHPLAVLRREEGPAAADLLLEAAWEAGVMLDVRHQVAHPDAALLLAASGHAVGIVSATRAGLAPAGVVVRELAEVAHARIYLAARQRDTSPLVASLAGCIRDAADRTCPRPATVPAPRPGSGS